jgi:MscS family membrane protein
MSMAFAFAFALAGHAHAGPATPATPSEKAEQEPIAAPDSPQAIVDAFLELGDRGEFEEAAAYVDLGRGDAAQGPELARRLHAVLSRSASINPELLSGKPEGDVADGLPRTVERIGEIVPDSGDEAEAVDVLLQRRSRGTPRWVFSRKTVQNVDAWYESLHDRWLIDNLPEPLLRTGWGGLAYWQWLALPGWLALAWFAGWALGRITRRMVGPLVARTRTEADDMLLRRFSGPLTLLWTLAVCRVTLPLLSLLPRPEALMHEIFGAVLVLLVFWGALRAVDLLADMVNRSSWAAARSGTKALLPLASRIVKVVVGALAIVAVFAKLDYPIASLLAGLGIGGLAVALAAQKSFENLIGAFAIGADQPFREGDFVRVEDFVGTVEAIGLRSTRFRTLDRTVITIPNGKLADMRLETLAARDRLRLACTLGLTYGTSEAQIREILEGLRTILAEHPKTWKDNIMVRFVGFGASSLDLEIMVWFATSDWNEFVALREDVLLAFMGVVERAGSSFAFPTRTVHLVRDPVGERPAGPG